MSIKHYEQKDADNCQVHKGSDDWYQSVNYHGPGTKVCAETPPDDGLPKPIPPTKSLCLRLVELVTGDRYLVIVKHIKAHEEVNNQYHNKLDRSGEDPEEAERKEGPIDKHQLISVNQVQFCKGEDIVVVVTCSVGNYIFLCKAIVDLLATDTTFVL